MVFAKHATHLVRDDMPTIALSRSILLGRKTTCVDLASRSITSFPRSHHYPQMFLRLPKSLRGKRRECAGGNKRRIRGARIFTPESTVVHCRPVFVEGVGARGAAAARGHRLRSTSRGGSWKRTKASTAAVCQVTATRLDVGCS